VADWLFVAQNFDSLVADGAYFADPFTCGRPPVAFYRLSAGRYSFLCHRLQRARKAHENGLLAADRLVEAERRFGLIEDWAWQNLPHADLVRVQTEELPSDWPAVSWRHRLPLDEAAGIGRRLEGRTRITVNTRDERREVSRFTTALARQRRQRE
jgi:hypothetical protein